MTRDRVGAWAEVGVVAGAVLVGSTLPLPERRDTRSLGGDKLLHAGSHAWLTRAVLVALEREAVPAAFSVPAALTLSAGYSVAVERVQHVVPGRRAEVGDVVASALGSLVGAALWARSRRP